MIPIYKRILRIITIIFLYFIVYYVTRSGYLIAYNDETILGRLFLNSSLFSLVLFGVLILYIIYELFSYLSERRNELFLQYKNSEDEKSKVLNEVKKKPRKKEDEINLENMAFFYSEIKSRLLSEIKDLGTKSNINLAIGLSISIIAFFFLGYSALFVEISNLENTVKFLPRVSFVILVEFLAYFFLGLYKKNLEEIKYYQNELTNVDFKFMAFYQLIENHVGGDKALSGIQELLKTERNRFLNKNQTTEELERLRNESSNNKLLFNSLLKIKRT